MPCACGKNKSTTTQTYTVKVPGQAPKTYSSEIEAKAAAQRVGGTVVRST